MAYAFMVLLTATLLLASATGNDKQDLIITFPNQIRSERDLPNCATVNSVCSILQKRYWLPSILYRYCRCPDEGVDCPDDWTGQQETTINATDLAGKRVGPNYSMFLNNRAQLKFCSTVQAIATCEPYQTSITIRMNASITEPHTEQVRSTSVLCKCPPNHAWLRSEEATIDGVMTSTYTCKPLKRCRLKSTCGAITADNFSIYPYCLCRKGHVCTVENRTMTHVDELHYSGRAYLGVCKPILNQ